MATDREKRAREAFVDDNFELEADVGEPVDVDPNNAHLSTDSAQANINFKKSSGVQRGRAFSEEEDIVICSAWLDLSKVPIIEINQKKVKLWDRILEVYNKNLSNNISEERTSRSLSCRFTIIKSAVNKFRGCVRQIENLNPSGASEIDILKKAKSLFKADPNERKGFAFEHVWPILKDFEKWAEPKQLNKRNDMHQEESQPGTPMSVSSGTPSSVNLGVGGDETETAGRKKAKVKKQVSTENSQLIASMVAENHRLIANLERTYEKRQNRFSQMDTDSNVQYRYMMLKAENEHQRLALEKDRQEMAIMERDISSISDPMQREYFQRKQVEILQKYRTSLGGGTAS